MSKKPSSLQQQLLCKEFLRENLGACAADVLFWKKKGQLPPKSTFDKAASILSDPLFEHDAHRIAEGMLFTVLLEHVAELAKKS